MTQRTAPATLSEVARKAGVGTTTVSRVINGGERVSARTLAHVRRVIEELGYRPNQAARVLKGDRTRTIGIIIPSIADQFFANFVEAAQAVARANDSLLIVTTTHNDPHIEIENLNILMSHRVDGLLITPANSQSQALGEMLDRLGIPVVAIDRPVSQSPIACVLSDNFKGARSAVTHLIGHGYKRIACLTGESTLFTIQERIRGYRVAVEGAGLPFHLNTSAKDYKSTEYAIESMLAGSNPVDALFTLKNRTTIHAFEALQKLNVAIPKTVELVGFDDFALASTVRPAITVVQQQVEEIGRVAAELLFEQLLGKRNVSASARSRKTHRVTLETRLIPRSSCGCFAAG